MRQIPLITLHFERYRIYQLRKGPLPFEFVICLSSTENNHRKEVKNITFLPLIDGLPRHDNDIFRVPIFPESGSSVKLNRRMYAAVDAIQSIGKAAFMSHDLGHITDIQEKEVREKLNNWLGL